MKEKAIIFSCMLLFAFISTAAVPSSRSLKSISDEYESNQYLYHEFKLKNERMDIEVTDYKGTGANTHHDPGSPPPAIF